MAEQKRAERAGEEGDAERDVGVEGLGLGRGFREEHRPEHQRRRGAENIEIVELDRRADEARERDLADAAPRPLRLAAASAVAVMVVSPRIVYEESGCWRRVPPPLLLWLQISACALSNAHTSSNPISRFISAKG